MSLGFSLVQALLSIQQYVEFSFENSLDSSIQYQTYWFPVELRIPKKSTVISNLGITIKAMGILVVIAIVDFKDFMGILGIINCKAYQLTKRYRFSTANLHRISYSRRLDY